MWRIETIVCTHKATLVEKKDIDFALLNPPFPYIGFCLICCQVTPRQKSDPRDFLPTAVGLLISELTLVSLNYEEFNSYNLTLDKQC